MNDDRRAMPLCFDLYLVVSGAEPELERALVAIRAAPPGRLAVQARWKDEADTVIVERVTRLIAAARPRGVPVLVSARPELARTTGADGLHIPERGVTATDARAQLGPNALVGASCHDRAGVIARAAEGVDFVVLGPIGEVPGKARAIESAVFREIARTTTVPVFALGGVRDGRDVARARALHATGVAVQRAICGSDRPDAVLADLLAALDAAR